MTLPKEPLPLRTITSLLLAAFLAAAPARAGDAEEDGPGGGPPVVRPVPPPPGDGGDGPEGGEDAPPTAEPRAEEKPRLETVLLRDPDGVFHLYDPPDAPPLRTRALVVLLHAERVPAAEAILELVPEARRRGWILAAPESRALQWRNPDGDIILATVEAVARRLAVDPERVILAGAGSGGLMATRWGLANLERFAAVVAHAGAQIPDLPKRPKDLPVFLSVGAKDEEWRAEVPAAVEVLRKAGLPVGFAEWPALGHEDRVPGVWTRAFDHIDGVLGETRRRLDRAELARRQKRWADAWAEAKAVLVVEKERPRLLDAAKEVRYAEQAAMDLVKRARDLGRRDPETGRRMLEDLAAAFPGSEVAVKAGEDLAAPGK